MSVRPTPKEVEQEKGTIGEPREVVLFEGQWNNNQPLRGRQINWKKNEVYDGYFDHWGGYSGSGSLTLADGSLYRGKFRAGMRNGRGAFTNAITGHVLDGNWEANMMQGFGAEWSKEGKLLQLGLWQDNELQTEQPVPASALYDKHGWTERAREKATLFYPDGSWSVQIMHVHHYQRDVFAHFHIHVAARCSFACAGTRALWIQPSASLTAPAASATTPTVLCARVAVLNTVRCTPRSAGVPRVSMGTVSHPLAWCMRATRVIDGRETYSTEKRMDLEK